MEYVNCLGSVIKSDTRCKLEIKSRIALAKAALRKKTVFTSKLDLDVRKKLGRCYIWSICSIVWCWNVDTSEKYVRNTWKVLKCGAVE